METETIHRPKGTSHERKALSRPVDLVHLSHSTLGERVLEREVLELFCTQSTMYLERLREAPSDQQWKDSAHSLKGSAQGIGAWHAAAAAERAELTRVLPSARRVALACASSNPQCTRLRLILDHCFKLSKDLIGFRPISLPSACCGFAGAYGLGGRTAI